MRIPRIYTPEPLDVGAISVLDEKATRHVVRVLRLGTGAEIILFNGRGGEYRGRLLGAKKNNAEVVMDKFVPSERESHLRLSLAQAISRHERMDLTIQKAVELGVAEVIPVQTDRTVIRLTEARAQTRTQHWQAVAVSACEQCGRNRVPVVHTPRRLADWLRESNEGVRLLLGSGGEPIARNWKSMPAAVTLLVGPEGGFTEAERALARHWGYSEVALGPRTLRTETAAIAALAILQAWCGDLSL